jgi:hypothetical protein
MKPGNSTWKIALPPGASPKLTSPPEPCDDLLHDAQPEAGAAKLPDVRCIGLRRHLEDTLLEVLRNAVAVAVVSHGDTDVPAQVGEMV